MRIAVQRARRRVSVLAGAAAEAAGRLVRAGRSTVPGALGAVAIAYGLGQIYQPLLFVSAGVFLLLIDRDV